ncbi:MAG TPA: 4a-hydroxytetrahydrobiopterin dehydratase [Nitrososphaeraceae archaeon]
MNNCKKLSDNEIEGKLKELRNWQIEKGKLCKSFEFKNFTQAFGFITKIALESEKLDHHPELFNVFNKVKIFLSTHKVNGISEYDFILAKKIDDL